MESRKIKVLAIDDNPDNLISLKALIKDMFPEAVTLTALSGALGMALAASEDPDVILLDIVMPGMDGFEVCSKLKADKKLSEIPVVFITAIKGDRESRIRALESGGDAFLAKPIDESELIAQIRAMVKIKDANLEKRDEKVRLTRLVEEQTVKLQETYGATLVLLENLRKENEARKRSEEVLRESEERFRSVAQSANDAIITANSSGIILGWNQGAERIFGYSEAEIIGQALSTIIPRGYAAGHHEGMLRLAEGHEHRVAGGTIELRGVHKYGHEFPLELSLAEWTTSTGKYFTGIIRDITERKRTDEQRERLEQQLFRSQRTESIGTLAAGIAHDFNNILNVIMGNAELVIGAHGDREKVTRRVDAILRASERGSSVVKQLLTLAQKTDIQPSVMNVNEIIRETIELLEETFPKTVVLRTELDPDLPSVNADSNQLHQVLLNLSMNARDAMPKGGTLSFTTGVAHGATLAGRFPAAATQPYVSVIISDNGYGMTDEIQHRIFDPFYTTKEKGKGTGLGLAVVMGIVESHHGFIDVSSRVAEGSEFSIYLPAIARDRAADDRPERAHTDRLGGQETILFIEDEELIRETAVDVLTENGYTVLQAANGEEGVELYRAHSNAIDVVLSDYGLPRFDGEEVYVRIRQVKADVRFVLLTGFMETHVKARLIEEGVRAILLKPYKLTDLLGTVRDVLDGPIVGP